MKAWALTLSTSNVVLVGEEMVGPGWSQVDIGFADNLTIDDIDNATISMYIRPFGQDGERASGQRWIITKCPEILATRLADPATGEWEIAHSSSVYWFPTKADYLKVATPPANPRVKCWMRKVGQDKAAFVGEPMDEPGWNKVDLELADGITVDTINTAVTTTLFFPDYPTCTLWRVAMKPDNWMRQCDMWEVEMWAVMGWSAQWFTTRAEYIEANSNKCVAKLVP